MRELSWSLLPYFFIFGWCFDPRNFMRRSRMDSKSQRSSIWWTRRTSQERFAKAGGSCLLSGWTEGQTSNAWTLDLYGSIAVALFNILELLGRLEAGEQCRTQANDPKAWKHHRKSLAERLLNPKLNLVESFERVGQGRYKTPVAVAWRSARKSYICPWYFPFMNSQSI